MNHNQPRSSEPRSPGVASETVAWAAKDGSVRLGGRYSETGTALPLKDMAHSRGMRFGLTPLRDGDTVIIHTASGRMLALSEGFCSDENGKLHRLPVQEKDNEYFDYAHPDIPDVVVGTPWQPMERVGVTDDPVVALDFDHGKVVFGELAQRELVEPIPFDVVHSKVIDYLIATGEY